MTITEHGTYAGLQRHRRYGDNPCPACLRAGREYQREYRQANPGATRRVVRANQRALWLLKAAHPEEYEALYVYALTEDKKRRAER